MKGPLISLPVTAHTGILPEKMGCWTLALPAAPRVGFLGPLGIDAIFGGAVIFGAGAGAGAAAGAGAGAASESCSAAGAGAASAGASAPCEAAAAATFCTE